MCLMLHVLLVHVAHTGTLCNPSEMEAAEKGHLKKSREVLKSACQVVVQRNTFKIELPLQEFPILTDWEMLMRNLFNQHSDHLHDSACD